MAIRIDIADEVDLKYSNEVNLPEAINDLVDEVVAQKPEKYVFLMLLRLFFSVRKLLLKTISTGTSSAT